MIRRLLYIVLFLLFIPNMIFADAALIGEECLDSACDDCADQGNAEFLFTADHSTSNVTACGPSGDLTGTLNDGAAISTSQNHTASSCDASADSSLYNTSDDDDISFSNAGGQFNSTQSCVDMWVYPPATRTASEQLFDGYYDANNRLYIIANSDGRITAYHKGQAQNAVLMNTVCTISASQWNHVVVKFGEDADYTQAGEELAISCDGGSTWEYDTDADPLYPFSSEPTTINIGEGPSGAGNGIDDYYIDDVKVFNTSDCS